MCGGESARLETKGETKKIMESKKNEQVPTCVPVCQRFARIEKLIRTSFVQEIKFKKIYSL